MCWFSSMLPRMELRTANQLSPTFYNRQYLFSVHFYVYFWLFIRLFTAQYLIHQGVVAIIGPAMSSDVMFTQPYFAGFNVPQFAPVATNPTFSFTPANFPYLLRMSPSDTVQCQALAGIIEHYNWTQFALLVSKDDYGIFCLFRLYIKPT